MDTLVLMPRTASTKESVRPRMTSAPAPEAELTTTAFETEAAEVLSELALAFRRLVEALPVPIERPAHLQKLLKVKYNTAWRTLTVIRANPPIAAGADVPTPRQLQQLLDGAARQEVKPSVLERVRRAYAAFEALVHRHAGKAVKSGSSAGKGVGGRAIFDALLGAVHGDAAARQEVVHRRAAYKGNSFIWGQQARTLLRCVVWHQGATNEALDAALISGFSQVHALRIDTPLDLKRQAGARPTPTDDLQRDFQPSQDVHVLDEFSTRPLPKVVTSRGRLGVLETTLRFDGIGKEAAVNCYMSEIVRNAGRRVMDNLSMTALVAVPAEVLLLTMLVPKGLCDPKTLGVTTHGNPTLLESLRDRIPEFALPVKETAEYIGTSLKTLETTDVPRYPQMVESVLKGFGWNETEFDIFRCCVRYPILQTFVHLTVNSTS